MSKSLKHHYLEESDYLSGKISSVSPLTFQAMLNITEMGDTEGERFKREVFLYCTDNLVKLVVYIPSPTITSYLLTEVIKQQLTLHSSVSHNSTGDYPEDLHLQHGRTAWSLHGPLLR